MSKMLGKDNVPIAKANVAATDFHRQNRLRTRKFSEHFSKQSGKFSLGKGLHEVVKCPHLKALQCQMAYVAQIQAGSIDIMVMPEKLYQTLKKNEPFADLKELMGEEAFEKFGMQTDTTHISITDSELEQELGVIYDPVCIAVPYSAPNQENAVKWIKSLDSRK